MTLGNFPRQGAEPIEGKIYWKLSLGRNAVAARYFEGGWRAFEFIMLKRYSATRNEGDILPHIIRIAFAYWLPFYLI